LQKSNRESFGRVLKRSLFANLIQVKLHLVDFYLNGGLHAISIGKPPERMSNFWMIQFLKTESELTSVFRTCLFTTTIETALAPFNLRPPDTSID